MNKRDKEYWEKYFPEQAIRWKRDPWHLVHDLESIMDSPCYTAREKLKLMQRAMETHNNARKETSMNPTDSGRHRTSCPEHTED